MINIASMAQQRIPVPEELVNQTGISVKKATLLKDVIIRNINTDSHTRLRMFNLAQQNEIISVIPYLPLREDTIFLLGVISRFIVQLLQPSISATLGMIDLRNRVKKALGKTRQQND